MGDALVMFAVAEEVLALGALRIRDPETGRLRTPTDTERRAVALGKASDDVQNACYVLEVPVDAVWQPPEKPWREAVADWHDMPEFRERHGERIRDSLQEFINDRLARLSRMLATTATAHA